MTTDHTPDLDALAHTVDAMRQAGVSGVTLSVDEADALIAAARERDALVTGLGQMEQAEAKLAEVEQRASNLAEAWAELHRALAFAWTNEFQPGGKFEGALSLGDTMSVDGGKWLVARVAWLEERSDRLTEQLAAERHVREQADKDREQAEQREARLRAALNELTAMVRGECPSLLNEDSGGDGALAVEIDAALAEGQDG